MRKSVPSDSFGHKRRKEQQVWVTNVRKNERTQTECEVRVKKTGENSTFDSSVSMRMRMRLCTKLERFVMPFFGLIEFRQQKRRKEGRTKRTRNIKIIFRASFWAPNRRTWTVSMCTDSTRVLLSRALPSSWTNDWWNEFWLLIRLETSSFHSLLCSHLTTQFDSSRLTTPIPCCSHLLSLRRSEFKSNEISSLFLLDWTRVPALLPLASLLSASWREVKMRREGRKGKRPWKKLLQVATF